VLDGVIIDDKWLELLFIRHKLINEPYLDLINLLITYFTGSIGSYA